MYSAQNNNTYAHHRHSRTTLFLFSSVLTCPSPVWRNYARYHQPRNEGINFWYMLYSGHSLVTGDLKKKILKNGGDSACSTWGTSINDVRLFWMILDLPTMFDNFYLIPLSLGVILDLPTLKSDIIDGRSLSIIVG